MRADIGEVRYYAAMKTHQIVGLTGLYTLASDPTEVWIGWFGIDERMRGQGLGHELLKATVTLACSNGYETLRLWTTNNPDFTAAANRLYKAFDFVPESIGVKYYGSPVLIYSRALKGGRPSPFHGSIPKMLVGADFRKVQMGTI
jgi:GNAT superfamily N-acetyltransferase